MYAHNETKVWTSFSKRIQAISNTSINSSRWFRSNCILSRVPKYRVLSSLHYLQALEISMDDKYLSRVEWSRNLGIRVRPEIKIGSRNTQRNGSEL